jgi:methenyltetrahydromethanopterin cyclohydrolase
MTSLNEGAWGCFQAVLSKAPSLGVALESRVGGTLILDAGVNAAGGLEAGLMMARIGMSGLGEAVLEMLPVDRIPWLWVTVRSDYPLEACFLSQAAHWPVAIGDFHAMGSGPACMLKGALDIGANFDYQESATHAVLVLEGAVLPNDDTCMVLANKCGVDPKNMALIISPTSSLAGSAQIAARSVETGLHKLHQLGFDLRRVVSGMGRCPLAPPTSSDLDSLGKTNDMVMFGSQVWFSVKGVQDGELEDLAQRVPAAASPGYGEPFLQTLKKAGGFYAIDPGLFAPAEITMVNIDSGRVFHAGCIDQIRLPYALKG